jgi:chromosome segregation ATPase
MDSSHFNHSQIYIPDVEDPQGGISIPKLSAILTSLNQSLSQIHEELQHLDHHSNAIHDLGKDLEKHEVEYQATKSIIASIQNSLEDTHHLVNKLSTKHEQNQVIIAQLKKDVASIQSSIATIIEANTLEERNIAALLHRLGSVEIAIKGIKEHTGSLETIFKENTESVQKISSVIKGVSIIGSVIVAIITFLATTWDWFMGFFK